MLPFSSRFGRRLWLSISLFLVSFTVLAQQPKPDPKEMVFTIVEHSPEFPGGLQALKGYLNLNVHYPDSAIKAKVAGKVAVSFIVEPNGQLTQIYVKEGLGFGCDEEALRVVNAMPAWQPGTQSGRAIRVKYTLRISFGVK